VLNEELRNLYTPPDIIRVIKSRRMGQAGKEACMGELRNAYNIIVGKLTEREHSDDTGVDGKILASILRK